MRKSKGTSYIPNYFIYKDSNDVSEVYLKINIHLYIHAIEGLVFCQTLHCI